MAASSNTAVSISDPTDTSDTELVRAALAGDRDAYFGIWSKYSGLVQRLLRPLLGSGTDHADIRQEVFLRLFKRLGELRNPAALRGFVVSISLGVARNEARRRRIRSIVGLGTDDLPPETETETTFGQNEAREAVRALYSLLGDLSAEDRSLFIARFVEKMEMPEIASAHAQSLSTAKRQVARLVERVNERVERCPVLTEYVGRLGPAPKQNIEHNRR